MGMAEDSPRVACNLSDVNLTKNSTEYITMEGIIRENFSSKQTLCIPKSNMAIKNKRNNYALVSNRGAPNFYNFRGDKSTLGGSNLLFYI